MSVPVAESAHDVTPTQQKKTPHNVEVHVECEVETVESDDDDETVDPNDKAHGTMLKDSAVCETGMLIFADPCMPPTTQDKKQFALSLSTSPQHEGTTATQPAHVAETLRQAYFSGCQPGKSCVGGDAWFGGVQCCLALKLQEVTQPLDTMEKKKRLSLTLWMLTLRSLSRTTQVCFRESLH